jgi:hypothetical protein
MSFVRAAGNLGSMRLTVGRYVADAVHLSADLLALSVSTLQTGAVVDDRCARPV